MMTEQAFHRSLNVVRLHAAASGVHLTSEPPKVAVIGCGRWGRNLIRNFASLDALGALIDASDETLHATQASIPETADTPCFESLASFLQSEHAQAVSGIVIATPTHTHYDLARQALEAGKHVYVEKPLATSEAEVMALETLANAQAKCLMVGHLLLFHPAVRRLRQLVEQGELGTVQSIDSIRLNTNPFRPDVSVLWDLAPHDLSMMAYVLGGEPLALQSVRAERTQADQKVDIGWLEALIDSPQHGLIPSHLHVSWVHPEKQVKLTVRGDRRTAILDDAQADNKLLLFDNSISSEASPDPQHVVPYLDLEPLRLECQHFLNALRAGCPPLTHAQHALPLVRLLEDAHRKIL